MKVNGALDVEMRGKSFGRMRAGVMECMRSRIRAQRPKSCQRTVPTVLYLRWLRRRRERGRVEVDGRQCLHDGFLQRGESGGRDGGRVSSDARGKNSEKGSRAEPVELSAAARWLLG